MSIQFYSNKFLIIPKFLKFNMYLKFCIVTSKLSTMSLEINNEQFITNVIYLFTSKLGKLFLFYIKLYIDRLLII